MQRRRFNGLAATALLLARAPASGQAVSEKVWRVGFLSGAAQPPDGAVPPALRETLRSLGFVEGRNIVYEGRWLNADTRRIPGFLSELLALPVDLLITQGAPSAAAARRATTTVPVVVIYAGDMVETQLVASLAHPGGNITGINDQSSTLSTKRLELIKEVVPNARRIAVLWNSSDQAMMMRYRNIERAAQTLKVDIDPLAVKEPDDFDGALAGMERNRPDALMLVADALANQNRQRVIDYAAAHGIPAIYEAGFNVRAGGLMAYGDDVQDIYRIAANYVARILKGAKPDDLPVQQPDRYYLLINLKTARSLAVTIPASLRLSADELIE